jgi:crotonobetainyl-CoA:carnitine CoA-transferase CaiB-like acyl-CoA transferase
VRVGEVMDHLPDRPGAGADRQVDVGDVGERRAEVPGERGEAVDRGVDRGGIEGGGDVRAADRVGLEGGHRRMVAAPRVPRRIRHDEGVKPPASPPRSGPLAGVRVLDLTRVLAGPFATMMLADLGADVIKVESPAGDETRRWGPPWVAGESAYFTCVNRNKRGIVLDFAAPEARARLLRLVEQADVLIENFRVGTMERWGLGYEEVLQVVNPRLVYCSITGFGRSGPYAARPGYDPIVEALTGFMAINGEEGGRPLKVGVAVIDEITGCQAAFAVTAALLHRDRTGEGQRVDLSLFESGLSALANQASAYLMGGEIHPRLGNAHPHIVPTDSFATANGVVMVCVGTDAQFARLASLLGVPELAVDPRFAGNAQRVAHREALTAALAAAFARVDGRAFADVAADAGVPIAPVLEIDQVFEQPQVAAREMLIDVPHPSVPGLRQVGFPIKFSATPAALRLPPPRLGEHDGEIDAAWDEVG